MVRYVFPNLRAEQARNGFSNLEVASRIGLSRSAYEQKCKSGRFLVDEAAALCALFNCRYEYLFDRKSAPEGI